MLSRTAEYAIRAVLALADRMPGEARPASEIARELGVPANYLSKTLNRLARRGLLVSVRGPKGGFRLGRPAASITLAEVVAEFDEVAPSGQCVMEARACDPSRPCVAHETWKRWSESVVAEMSDTTVADFTTGGRVAGSGQSGRPASVTTKPRAARMSDSGERR